MKNTGYERLADLTEVVLVGGVVEGVLITLEQRQVCMHPRSRKVSRRLRHESRIHVSLGRQLLDDKAIGHDGVRHRQRIGMAQIDLVLTGRNLVVRELDGNAHLFENTDRVASKVLCNVEWSEIEVTAGIDRRRIVDALEEEELHLWMNVEGETALCRLVQIAPEDETRVAPKRPAIGRMDITEHAGHAPVGPLVMRGHDLKSSRIGSSQHV